MSILNLNCSSLISFSRHHYNNFLLKNILKLFSTCSTRIGDESYTRIGRFYEEKCQAVLANEFETAVNLVGGAGDSGIDLIWNKKLQCGTNLSFVAQCKFKEANRVAPETIRALKGSLVSLPTGTIGCLISNHRPSTDSLNLIKNSKLPLISMIISEFHGCPPIISEIFLNRTFKLLHPNVHVVISRSSKGNFQTFRWN